MESGGLGNGRQNDPMFPSDDQPSTVHAGLVQRLTDPEAIIFEYPTVHLNAGDGK